MLFTDTEAKGIRLSSERRDLPVRFVLMQSKLAIFGTTGRVARALLLFIFSNVMDVGE